MLPGFNPLVMRVADGDPGAFRELFETFSPKVYGFALKLTHSPAIAEELVQEVFMKIWMYRGGLRGVEHFPAYLYTITRNLTFNVLKRLSAEQKAKAEYIKGFREDVHETEETVIGRDYQNILQNAIDKLSPQQKLVYSLCHGEGMKYEEAAEKLHISRLTVKTHMQQAIRSIKTHFRRVVVVLAVSAVSIF
jgi:RNA polymerase sigma-70 factor (family 1)